MKIVPDAIYVKRKLPKGLKIIFEKTPARRPAWIWAKGLPDKAAFMRFKIGKLQKSEYYRTFLLPQGFHFFLPVNWTKDEIKRYYDKLSKKYDVHVTKTNISAADFLINKLKVSTEAKILDLGAGTGITSERLIAAGYKNMTLVDISKNMLNLAKKKHALQECKFIRQDVRNLKLKEKFDLAISILSFAYTNYYKEEEMPALWRIVAQHLKHHGVLALFGHNMEPPAKLFKKIKTGTYLLSGRWKMPYYIGVKR